MASKTLLWASITFLTLFGPSVLRLQAEEEYSAREFYAMGRSALEEEDYFSAVDYFRTAIRLNPAYSQARMGMAEVLYLLGEYEEAHGEIEDARTYAFADRRFVLLEARILTALGGYEEAMALYNDILESRPHDPEANRGLAEIYAISGQNELADEAYSISLLYSPGNLRVLLQLVILHNASRSRERAENALLEALRRYPNELQVRIQAAEHYALYKEWERAADHLDRALSMLKGRDDGRYRRVAMLDAILALRRGDPARALAVLDGVRGMDEPDMLYLSARAYRSLGMEEEAQSALRRILSLQPENEIVRIYREHPLVKRKSGFDRHRDELSRWHLELGREAQDRFYFDRALGSYRRARLINATDAETWLSYADIIRLKGFPEKYRDELNAAFREFGGGSGQARIVAEKLALLEHSAGDSLGAAWGIEDAWNVESAAWTMAIFFDSDDQDFLLHDGAASAISSYFAYLADLNSDITVVDLDGGFGPGVRQVDSFTEAFRISRSTVDYFVLLKLGETERSFDATASLYIGRTGEEITTLRQLRTGQGKVSDALELLARDLGLVIPGRMRILGTDGDTMLLDKGRWHGVSLEDEYVVLRSGTVRPAISEQGVSFDESDYLGTMAITQSSESLSVGEYRRHGDFDFLSPGDDLLRLAPPDLSQLSSMPDPAFRSRLLAVP